MTAGQTALTQTLTNASSTGGTVNGYSQTITVSNTSSASTTNGFNITLTDNTSLANTNTGIKISLAGSNTSSIRIGLDSNIGGNGSGIGVRGTASTTGSSSVSCGTVSGTYGIGVCGDSDTNGTAGVVGHTAAIGGSITDITGTAIYGISDKAGNGSGQFYTGVRGIANQTGAFAYTSTGVFGQAKAGAGATTYGGYFTLQGSSAVLGSALYATNNTVAANILDLQDNTTSVFTVGDGGLITMQPAASLTAGQTALAQTLTNASSTGGTVNGYSQTISVAPTSSASTTNGFNISLTDNTALANTNNGIKISLAGSNTSQAQIGIDITVTKGIGIKAVSSGAGAVCNGASGISAAACLDSSSSDGIGLSARSTGVGSINSTGQGSAVYGLNTGGGGAGSSYFGLKGVSTVAGGGGYNAIGVFGAANANTLGDNIYGGYFTYLATGNASTAGAALYASNSTIAANILDLQDSNAGPGSTNLSVFTVADNGAITARSSSSAGFQVQNTNSVNVMTVDTSASLTSLQGINSVAAAGSELVTSQDFTDTGKWTGCNTAGWSGTSTTTTHSSGTTTCSAAAGNFTVTNGTYYQISFQLASNSSDAETVIAAIGGASAPAIGQTGTNTHNVVIKAGSTAALTFTPTTGFTGAISSVSVKAITGTNSILSINNSNASAGIDIRSGGATLKNTFIGVDSGLNNISGHDNTSIGTSSLLSNTTGNFNIAVGSSALKNNTTGNNNSGIGATSLASNTTGSDNNGVGINTLNKNTVGSRNSAVGSSSLFNNTTGNDNSAIGSNALNQNTSGSNNIANGSSSLFNNSTGGQNVGVGGNTLRSSTTGSNNTAIGYNAGYQDPVVSSFATLTNLQNATLVGYGAQAQASNVIILGGVGSTGNNITPNIGIGTTAPTNIFSVSPDIYDTGTAYQDNGSAGVAGTTIHGIGTTWTAGMVGNEFIFSSGEKETITGFTNTTTLTGSVSQAVGLVGTAKAYRVHNQAFFVSSTGRTQVRTSSNSTTAFQVQNSSGQNVLATDTTNGKVILGNSSAGVDGTLVFNNSSGANTATITLAGNPTTSYNYQLPTGTVSSNQCLQSGTVSGANVPLTFAACGSGGTLASTYNSAGTSGNTITYTTAGAGIVIQDASTPLSGNLLTVQNNGATFNYLSLNLASSVPHLKVFGASSTAYADIYYDAGTSTAHFAASTGTTEVGSGSGPVTIDAGTGGSVTITADAASSFTTTTGALTLTGAAASTFSTSAGLLTVQGGGGLSLLGSTTSTVTVDSGTTGNVVIGATNTTNAKAVSVGNANSGSTTTIEGGTAAGAIAIGNGTTAHGIQIGTNATGDNDIAIGGTNTGSTYTLEAGTASSAIQIGNGATAHGIQIGTGAAVQTLVIGSTNGASVTTIQGGSGDVILATSAGNTVQIGSGTADANVNFLQLDSDSDFSADEATCNATTNQGAMYYNTTSNAIRGCINSGWEDVVSTASLGLQLFGVVPDSSSGSDIGDLAGVTALPNGPCKVSEGGTTSTVSWKGCVAFSGGRKVIVAAGTTTTASGTSATVIWQHLCLTAANSQPALSAIGVETANLATVSMTAVSNPILCLADIKVTNGSAVITGIYNTATYTTSAKEFASAITTAPALGMAVKSGTTTPGSVTITTATTETKVIGVIVASTGATSTSTLNVVVALNGPAWVKAITGTNAVGDFIIGTATGGYTNTATFTSANGYTTLGMARTAWTTACAINSLGCNNSILTNIAPR
jgi:hypothetical protein